MKRGVGLSLGFVACVMVGCGNKPQPYVATPVFEEKLTVNAESEHKMLPSAPGCEWTYTFEQAVKEGGNQFSLPKRTVTYRVINSADTPDGKQITMDILEGDKKLDRQVFSLEKDGLYQIASGPESKRYSPKLPVVRYPLKSGDRFTWTGTGPIASGKVGKSTQDTVVEYPQTVDTEWHSFQSILAETKVSYPNGANGSLNRMWIYPGVGIVRYYESSQQGTRTIETTLRLQSYLLK